MAERFYYFQPEGSLSSPETMEQIRQAASACGATLVVIDSLSFGMGADVNQQDEVSRVIQELNSLPTVLALDHVPKTAADSDGSRATPLGSAMKINGARSVIMLSRSDGDTLALHIRKSNFGKHGGNIGYAMCFDEEAETVCFESREVIGSGSRSRLNAGDTTLLAMRELFELNQEPMSVHELHEFMATESGLEITVEALANRLSPLRRKGLIERVSRGRWQPTHNLTHH